MKNRFILLGVTFLLAIAIIVASCSTSKSTATSSTPAQSSTTTVSVATSATSTVNWWVSLGSPVYGGTLTEAIGANIEGWDPYNFNGGTFITDCWDEDLIQNNWQMSPAAFNFQGMYVPMEDTEGSLVQSYEWTTTDVVTMHLRQGINWQNLPPANGRAFTAYDVQYDFDRYCGIGDGFTQITPFLESPTWKLLTSVSVTDNYTAVFTFNGASAEAISETLFGTSAPIQMESPDVVKQDGNTLDWHHAIGTGPFILTNFVDDSSASLSKNPNYWGHDERYPNNALPYVDNLTILVIPDQASTLAALRTGKIDVCGGVSATDAASLKSTNPSLIDITSPGLSLSLNPVVNVPPFNDIKVREAVQEAINVPLIASNNYPGSSGLPESMTSNILTGWGYPYSQWPASLQQIYAYNPTQSKQLLAQAGYPNGINTTCEAENTADLNMLQIVKSYLSAVGINMTIQTMDEASWTDLVQTNKKAVGFSYKYWGGLDYSFPPIDQLGIYATGATFNTSIISDSIIDNANTKANTATASLDDVRAASIAVNQEMAQQVYVISLLTPVTHNFQQPSLKGFDAQSGSIPEGTNSGALVGFYAARFWKSQ